MSPLPLFLLLPLVSAAPALAAATVEIQEAPVHLRSGAEREWNEFPAESPGRSFRVSFQAETNPSELTLSLRQRDVKNRTWQVRINDRLLGRLNDDERDMRTALAVPANLLRRGENTLTIADDGGPRSDDIELREMRLFAQPLAAFLRQSTVAVDTEVEGIGASLPVRITVVDSAGALVPLAALRESDREAIRTGVIYTADGRTELGLPAGDYRVFASRGWEYSAPSRRLALKAGQRERVRLRLKKEVSLSGFVSCDTHVHTLELSGHGDASVRERIVTAAGEGLDIIAATEHNQVADYSETVRKLGLERLLTVVRGNEVTTPMGHFNIFPLPAAPPLPNIREQDWMALAESIRQSGSPRVIVQNHPRDLHSKYRPFDPSQHLAAAGENLIGRPFFANAVEVVNSGAMQSDMLQAVRDWLGLLNRGYRVAAIGGSDTHTVDFVPIGQARTYIDVRGLDGEWKDAPEAVFDRLAAGENLVAYGLAADLRIVKVAETAGGRRTLEINVEVHGPSWSSSDSVIIYANGFTAAEYTLPHSDAPGLKWRKRIKLEVPANDQILVAAAGGPGVRHPFWEVRKSYQPVSKDWNPRVLGISKAVRVDVDGNGFQAPREYAEKLVRKHGKSGTADLVRELLPYDAGVAVQVLNLLAAAGQAPEPLREAFRKTPALTRAFEVFEAEWALRKSVTR